MRQWFIPALLGALILAACDRAPDTEKFLTTAATAGQFEIEASRIAATKATHQDVKAFAGQMISDHESAAQRLSAAAIESGRMPPPAGLDDRQKRKLEELRLSSGQDFDKLYVEQQLEAHEEAVALFSDYTKSNGDDGPIGRFAKETLPTLEAHLSHVRGLKATPIT
jgi:putative membrane protein